MTRVFFQTLGCKLNFAESSMLGKQLRAAGFETVCKGESADVCVLNTCTVTDVADQKGRQAIRRLHREHPDATLIVTGCYAELQPDRIAAIEGVDYVVGANNKDQILRLIEDLTKKPGNTSSTSDTSQTSPTSDTNTPSPSTKGRFPFHGGYSKDDRTRCFLKVQDGCDYFCTYCTIPMARGRSRNASIADTVALAQQAIDEGAKEIVLTGVNIGDFGRSTDETFIDLIRALDNVQGEVRYRISSCEPNLLSDEIIDFVAGSKHFAPHFHIPLQSGSNDVLKIMHRRYTRELFAERIEHIRKVMPHAFIGVDCMVGVRGETEEMFADYEAFVDALEVTQLHVFPYSERAHTRMVEMDLPRVAPAEQKRRVERLMAISERHLAAFYAKHKGTQATVLWESGSNKRTMAGWTENYIRVTAPYNEQKINQFEVLWI